MPKNISSMVMDCFSNIESEIESLEDDINEIIKERIHLKEALLMAMGILSRNEKYLDCEQCPYYLKCKQVEGEHNCAETIIRQHEIECVNTKKIKL